MNKKHLAYLIGILGTLLIAVVGLTVMQHNTVMSDRYEDIELRCCGFDIHTERCDCVEVWIDGEFQFAEKTEFIKFSTMNLSNTFINSVHAEDITDLMRYNQYLLLEIYPDPETPNEDRLGQRHDAVLYYYGPSKHEPTVDTLFELHWFNSVDTINASDITEVWYTID